MKILHLFGSYLPLTMSWAYLVLKNTPNVQPHIAALNLLENEYQSSRFIFWPNPRYGPWLFWLNRLMPVPVNLLFRKLKGYDLLLQRYARSRQISLLHAHFGNIGADYYKLGQRLKIPFVVSFYGIDYQRMLQTKPRYLARYQKMFVNGDAFICEGPYGGQRLAKMGCPQEKINIIHLGVETKQIPFYQRSKLSKNLKLVQIASFEGRKGHLDTIRAFSVALSKCPGLRLDLYGPPSDHQVYAAVRSDIQALGLQKSIRLLAPVPYTHLHKLLRDYDVFIQPSKHQPNGDSEGGAPITLLDAQATGMPIIATQHCDIPSEVIHNQTGLLAEEGNINELASYIKYFYEMDEQVYDQFSKAARLHIEQNFDSKSCSHKISKLYEKLIANSQSGHRENNFS